MKRIQVWRERMRERVSLSIYSETEKARERIRKRDKEKK